MKMKRLLFTVVITLTALFATCSIAFGSSAVIDSEDYTHPSKFSDTIVIDGIDVSYYQKDIDWGKVKRQGIDYAYIRLGFSYLASPHRLNLDEFFEQNYKNAREAGVMVGVYYYSTATTIKEAQKEAKFVLDALDGRELDLPVAYDFELDSTGRQHEAYYDWTASTRKTKATSNCLAFLNYIEKNSDYESMFYSFRNITSPYGNPGGTKLNMSLIDSKYRVWLAQYSTDNSYERPYDTWQYTSSGRVTGISGNVDGNFWYYDNDAEETKEGTKSIKNASVKLGSTKFEYTKYKKYPSVTVTDGGKTLTKDVDYKVHYIKNVLAGTAYAWIEGIGSYSNVKLVPFTITTTDIADGGTIADIADQTYSGKAKTPTVKVQYKGTTFKKGVDYTVSYSNNVNAGTATVKVTGKRNFHGTMTKTFKINKATPTFTGYVTYYRTPSRDDFTINTKCTSDAKLTYESDNTAIASIDSSGKVSLNGGIGTVTITVTSPETKNCKKAVRTVKIIVTEDKVDPPEPTDPDNELISSIESTTLKASSEAGDNYIRIKWTKSGDTQMDAFEIYRSTKSGEYDDKPLYTTSNGTWVSYKNTAGLENGTTYYYKVRGLKEVDGTTYYTKWSDEVSQLFGQKEPDNSGLIKGVENTTLKASSQLGNGYIRVKWTKSYGYKMDAFEIYRSTKSGQYGDKPLYTTPNGKWVSYKNTKSLKKGTRYYYKVRGVREIDGETYYSKWSGQAIRTYK